uniref:HTH_Tnp_Tc3_1 domain-containing protein n=1 Tax=Caenorhabditis japonica TaxID=281687 RepID=A0A8R1ELG5_CAEJA
MPERAQVDLMVQLNMSVSLISARIHRYRTVINSYISDPVAYGTSKSTGRPRKGPGLPDFGPPIIATNFEVYSDAPSTPAPLSSGTPLAASSFPIVVDTARRQQSLPDSIDPVLIAKHAVTLLEKSTRAVVERLPDDKSLAQDDQDFQMLTKFANGNSCPIPTKVHRHPCSSRFRPLKLQFDNKQDRDAFIKGFNKLRHTDPAITSIATKPRIRRDLTMPELDTLRASRKLVYDENKKAGVTKFIMSDINYKV